MLDVLFQHPLCNSTEAADIVFSNFNACAVLIYCFRFLAWIQVNDFFLRNVVIKNGLLTLAHALLTFGSRLLTLCSRCAHALGSFWVLTRSLLGLYEGVLTVCSRFAHGLLTVCSRFAHSLLALLTLCSCFAHTLGDDVCIMMKKPISKPCHFFVVPNHVYLRHTAFRLQTPWGWFSNLKKNTHMPFTSLRWSGVATPLPQPEMYVQRSFWA